jgi:molybdopterin/thiamine biosynthesis adenylyltransferase
MAKIRKPPIPYDEFYSRQLVLKELGRLGQENLQNQKLQLSGLADLGTASSLYLALAGVGHLRLNRPGHR